MLIRPTSNVAPTLSEVQATSSTIIWSKNQTKVFLDLYQQYRVKVGTSQIKNLKKLWEILAQELNKMLSTNVTAGHTENRWRVLERAYKKHVDNQNKTGRGRQYFEYVEEMEQIFKGKKNVNPVVLLSSESVEVMPDDEAEEMVQHTETPTSRKKEDNLKPKRTPIINRNVTLAHMRKDRREYQEARVLIEREKLDIQKRKVDAMEERNRLLEERNKILKKQKCVCGQGYIEFS